MNQLERFAELLFQEMPPGEEQERSQAAVAQKLQKEYRQYLKDGMLPEDALNQTLICFGAREAARQEYEQQKLLTSYRRFQKKYPVLIRCGFLGIVIVPLLFLILFSSLGSKLISLAGWIFSLVLLIIFVICVEYMDYRYKRQIDPSKRVFAETKRKKAKGDPEKLSPKNQEGGAV